MDDREKFRRAADWRTFAVQPAAPDTLIIAHERQNCVGATLALC
jgi:hypothetical protein